MTYSAQSCIERDTAPGKSSDLQCKFTFEWISVKDLDQDTLQQCYQLVLKLRKMYIESGMGWDAKGKKNDMAQPKLMYLIARFREEPSVVAGFLSVALEHESEPFVVESKSQQEKPEPEPTPTTKVDENNSSPASVSNSDAILAIPNMDGNKAINQAFVYELHVKDKYRGHGLGTKMMSSLVQSCKRAQYAACTSDSPSKQPFRILLTVFTCNNSARAFYQKQKFQTAIQPDGTPSIFNENDSEKENDDPSDDQETRAVVRRRVTRSGASVATRNSASDSSKYCRGWRELQLVL